MIDLNELTTTLNSLRDEMVKRGMPHSLVRRVEALDVVIPNIEKARERGAK